MSSQRGAAAPTSGAADVATVDEARLDAAVQDVAGQQDAWALTSPGERAVLLERIMRDTVAVADAWNEAACRAKGYAAGSAEAGEELFAGVGVFIAMAQAFRRSMLDLVRHGRPQYPGPVRHRPDERLSVGVMPASWFDRILSAGQRGEVWMMPGVTEADVQAGQAAAYRHPVEHQGVALVLGAGNVGSLGPRDVLSKLFAEGKVVVLKANPVNDYLVPFWTMAMSALIEAGFLRIVTGGAAAGAYLVDHPRVTEIHVTGSDKTYDAIVFGPGPDGAARKAANNPLVRKPVTGELGNVSPVVVVPGDWSAKDLDYQARHVATMLVNNAGFNCLTPRVLVTHEGWPQRGAFLDALKGVLARLPTRRAYYPGSQSRFDSFIAAHPDADQIGDHDGDRLPWTLIAGVDPTATDDVCLNVEAFCSLMAETALPASSPAAFVGAATEFCNDVVWGTLSMTLLAHPQSLADGATKAAVDEAVADLRYGTIGVNLWHALGFAMATTTWGAFPGHPMTDIQSGTGVVGNAFLFDRPQKSVVYGPFRSSPPPPWFATSTAGAQMGRKLIEFQADPRWLRVPGLLRAALR